MRKPLLAYRRTREIVSSGRSEIRTKRTRTSSSVPFRAPRVSKANTVLWGHDRAGANTPAIYRLQRDCSTAISLPRSSVLRHLTQRNAPLWTTSFRPMVSQSGWAIAMNDTGEHRPSHPVQRPANSQKLRLSEALHSIRETNTKSGSSGLLQDETV